MAEAIITCSPSRVQHLDIMSSQADITSILPDLTSLPVEGVECQEISLGWRGYRTAEEFVIDKAVVLKLEGDPLNIHVYTDYLAKCGSIGDILLYINNKEGIQTVISILVVDDSEDDVLLTRLIKEAAICLVDGYVINISKHSNGRLYTINSHFMELDRKTVTARTSLLYTRLSELNLDTRLLLTKWNSQVYYIDGIENEEEFIEDELVQEYATPGSVDELMINLRKEEN